MTIPRVSREDVNPEAVTLLGSVIRLTKPDWSRVGVLPQREFDLTVPDQHDTRRDHHGDAVHIERTAEVSSLLDRACAALGADSVSNCIVYPPNGCMNWHTNSNMPGQKLYYNFNLGRGFFFYRDVETGEIVDDHDNIGWTARRFDIPDRPPFLWHAVHTESLRFSFGFWFRQRERSTS